MRAEKRFHLGFTVVLQLLNMLTWQRGHLHPPPPSKNLPNETPPGCHPPILADGTHSSFLHTILLVRRKCLLIDAPMLMRRCQLRLVLGQESFAATGC